MITYRAMLDVPDHLCHAVTGWLKSHRLTHDSRPWQRAASCRSQAIMFLRWARDASRLTVLAHDAKVSLKTAYRYIHEAIDVVAAHGLDLDEVIAQVKPADLAFVMIDGTLIHSNRCRAKNPNSGHDLWYSGKHHHHGGNIQVLMDNTGYPLWTSPVEPGHVHDLTAAREHLLPALFPLVNEGLRVLADKGYDGAGVGVLTPVKGHSDDFDANTLCRNQLLTDLRAPAERANAMLKTWKCLHQVSLAPERIGDITAAMLVLTHLKYPSPYSW